MEGEKCSINSFKCFYPIIRKFSGGVTQFVPTFHHTNNLMYIEISLSMWNLILAFWHFSENIEISTNKKKATFGDRYTLSGLSKFILIIFF